MSPHPAVIFDASNCAYRRDGAKQAPDAAWLYQVVDAVLARLQPVRWSLVFDGHLFRGLRRQADAGHKARLRTDLAAGRVTECAADTEADAFILNAARAAGAVVVSNDRFRDHRPLRAGVPMLRVEAILGAPSVDGYLLVYPTAGATTPDRQPIPPAGSARRALAPDPASPAAAPGPMALIRQALEAAEAEALALSQAAHALRTALGKAEADALVAGVVGRKQGMWRALFSQGVPGWRLEGERVFRTPAAPEQISLDGLDVLRGHLGALVDSGVTDASALNSHARAHWGAALDARVAEAVGGPRAGRWIRFLQEAVPALTLRREGTGWQVLRLNGAGQPVHPGICAAVRATAALLKSPVARKAFVRDLLAAAPPRPREFDSVTALLKAFPDVIRLELTRSGQLRVHPMPGATPPPVSAAPSLLRPTAPPDELSARRAQHRRG